MLMRWLACVALLALELTPGGRAFVTTRAQGLRGRIQRDRRNIRPNIILIMTDDQDVELGRATPLPRWRFVVVSRPLQSSHCLLRTEVVFLSSTD